MADLNATHHPSLLARRRQAAGLDGTVHFAGEPKVEPSLTDKAQEYDRALRLSQLAAPSRRRFVGGGSVLGMSTIAPGPSSSSMFGGISTAQTAVLGDSQGSILPANAGHTPGVKSDTPLEDLEADGGVITGLGESYVDGAKRPGQNGDDEEDDEDGLRDGGVLSLLAQIYGRREGGAGVL